MPHGAQPEGAYTNLPAAPEHIEFSLQSIYPPDAVLRVSRASESPIRLPESSLFAVDP